MKRSLLDAPVSLNELAQTLNRHKVLVAVILITVTVAAAYLAIFRNDSKPIYVAQTAIQVLLSGPAEQIEPTLNILNLPITLKSPSFLENVFPSSDKNDTSASLLFGDVAVQEFFENLSVSPPSEAGVIRISFKSGSRNTAELTLKNYVEAALEKIKILQEQRAEEYAQKKVSIQYRQKTDLMHEPSGEDRLRKLSEVLDMSRMAPISESDENKNLQLWLTMFSLNSLTNSYFQREIETTRQELKAKKEAIPQDIIRVVEPISIVPPKVKSNAARAIILIAGIAFACLVGMATAMGIDRRSGLVNSQIDIEGLGLPVVAFVPQVGSETNFVQEELSGTAQKSATESPTGLQKALSGCEDVIVRLCLANQAGLKTIFIGSSKKGEGKTFVSISLAIQAAQAGKKTLLLECNFRDPKIATILKCSDNPGFSTFLYNRQKIADLPVIQTSFPSLSCVTAGQITQNSLPLFLSDHFRQTLTEIRQNFDYIFIDTPAILEHAEAVAIGALCDAQVVVARQECRPSLAEMETAVRKISHQDSVFLGVIMNGFVR